MESNTPAITKFKLEERVCCSAEPATPTEQQQQPTTTHMTQVFLIPQITQCKDLSNVERKVLGSSASVSDSCDSVATQSIYLDAETDTSDEDKPKSTSETMVSKSNIGLSRPKILYRKRHFESLSSEDYFPIPKEISLLLSEKESGNESGYSSQSASYVKCQPFEKGGVENLLDSSAEQLVDIESLDTKPNSTFEESIGISLDKKMRFLRTATALQRSGLMEITIKTADILKQNRLVNREIKRLREETIKFFQSVIRNPENQTFHETIAKNCNMHSCGQEIPKNGQ